jgi:predicted nucleic acid-binding protein
MNSPSQFLEGLHAIVHDLIVVTRNVADFDDTRASTLNPWDAR